MYLVTVVKIYDNHVIETKFFESPEECTEYRDKLLNEIMDKFPKDDFSIFRTFTYTSASDDVCLRVVIKIDKHDDIIRA